MDWAGVGGGDAHMLVFSQNEVTPDSRSAAPSANLDILQKCCDWPYLCHFVRRTPWFRAGLQGGIWDFFRTDFLMQLWSTLIAPASDIQILSISPLPAVLLPGV